jgi:hypothetical protein
VVQAAGTHWLPEQVVDVTFAVGHTAHTPPHSRVPLEQLKEQVLPLQLAVPSGSVWQGVQLAPQLATELLARQTPEQR